MGLVERSEPARPLSAESKLHDVLADGRGGSARAVVVGRVADRAAQSPVSMRAKDCVGHLDARAAFLALRALRRLLRHRTVGWPVDVEVVREHEFGACGGGAVEDGSGHRRKQLGPLRVGRLCAVVDDGSTLARLPGALGRADVGRQLLDPVRGIGRPAACRRPHLQSAGRELADQRGAGASRSSQNDVSGRHGHGQPYRRLRMLSAGQLLRRNTASERVEVRRLRVQLRRRVPEFLPARRPRRCCPDQRTRPLPRPNPVPRAG